MTTGVDDSGSLHITFIQPTDPLSINEAHRLHWAARRRRTNPWRDLAVYMARQALRGYQSQHGRRWEEVPVTITMTLAFRRAARRDPHNYVGTNVKAFVDGLVTGGLIPDDSPEWATILEPVLDIQSKPVALTGHALITPRS